VDRGELGRGVRSVRGRRALSEPSPNPFGGGESVASGEALDGTQFNVVEQDLKSLSHMVSVDDSSV
jgi:hypothetical protein